jgi:NADPH:quinone reductase-like Zn-dependent oxidoreductase
MPKLVRLHESGGPAVRRAEDSPLAEPGAREVRLQVEAIGLNQVEVMFRMGQYLETPELPARG